MTNRSDFARHYKGVLLDCTPELRDTGRWRARLQVLGFPGDPPEGRRVAVSDHGYGKEAVAANIAWAAGRRWVDGQDIDR